MHFNKYYHSGSQTAEPLMLSFNFCFMTVSIAKIQILKNKIGALIALKKMQKTKQSAKCSEMVFITKC